MASRTSLGQHLQFFYADLNYPTRITHVYNHSSSEITSLYYDLQGHLFAMEISSGEEFYIACDNTGTPLAVFSSNGLLLKQVHNDLCVCVCVCLWVCVFVGVCKGK